MSIRGSGVSFGTTCVFGWSGLVSQVPLVASVVLLQLQTGDKQCMEERNDKKYYTEIRWSSVTQIFKKLSSYKDRIF
jgi:hypothetical protein